MKLTTFNHEQFGEIRVAEQNGEPWFIGKDVAEVLGYRNQRDALSRHIDEEDKGVVKHDTPGGYQNIVIINESGLCSLILSSPTQKAMNLGLFDIKETTITHSDGRVTVSRTVKLTGKGQQYFFNKFLRKEVLPDADEQ